VKKRLLPLSAWPLLRLLGHFAAVLLRSFLFPSSIRVIQRRPFFFPLQLLWRNDLVSQLGEIGRLRSAFAPEANFTLLEQASLVTKRDARPLAPDLQADFAEACADEAHWS
jgi:hypothetical protein